MPAALNVNKEAAEVLVGAVGVREAARQMGISENTMLAWANRGGWVQKIADARERKAKSVAASRPGGLQSPTIKAPDAMAELLAEGVHATRIGFTRYAARMAKQAGDAGLLEEAPLYKAVADIHGKMHPEPTGPDQSTHFAFFSVTCGRGETYEGDGVTHTLRDATDPMDDY